MLLVVGILAISGVIGAALFVAMGGLRPPTLKLPLKHLLSDGSERISTEVQRRASRTFSFTSFGIEKKPPGTGPQTSAFWRALGWSAWGIRQYPKTTKLGGKCDAPLTVGSRVFLTSLHDEWIILEIFCLPRFPTLPQAVLLQSVADPEDFILSFSGFKFPICWPFPGVRTGLPMSLLALAWDNFCEVRKAETCAPLPGEEAHQVVVNKLAIRYLRQLEGGHDHNSSSNSSNDEVGGTTPPIDGDGDGLTNTLVRVLSATAAPRRLLITGHSNGGSMAQVYSLILARRQLPNLTLSCSAHGAMRTGNRAFYTRLQSLGVHLTNFTYAAPCYEDATSVIVDEIPFAPVSGTNFQDPPEVYVMLTIKKRGSPTAPPKRVLKRLDPAAACINAPDTALTAPIPSFPKNHVAGLYEDFFVKMHEGK